MSDTLASLPEYISPQRVTFLSAKGKEERHPVALNKAKGPPGCNWKPAVSRGTAQTGNPCPDVMTLPFKVPLTDVSRIKGNWIDLWNNMVNRLLKVTLQAFCEGGQDRTGCER